MTPYQEVMDLIKTEPCTPELQQQICEIWARVCEQKLKEFEERENVQTLTPAERSNIFYNI